MSAARFRPPDNLGGWAPLGLSVSGRTILTTISKRIEVPSRADTRRSLKLLRSEPARLTVHRAPLSGQKSPLVLKLTKRPSNYGERPARIGLMSPLGVRRAKAALSSGCKPHPATRSSRKQSEQSWR